jgi:tetratricopeptide (TPR) repeat protein
VVPTPKAAFPAWLEHTWNLKTYRLHLQVHVTVERPDGHTDDGNVLEVAGAFDDNDLTYQQTGSGAEAGAALGARSLLTIIKAGGRTYARGPMAILELASPAWYQIDAARLSAVEPIYDVYTALPQIFGGVDLAGLRSAGTEALQEQRCERLQGNENMAPHMIAHLAGLPELRADQPVRQQLEGQGSRLLSSDATMLICPDGYLHRVTAEYSYQPPRESDGKVRWMLSLELNDLNGTVDITPPSDALAPPPVVAGTPASSELSAGAAAAVAELVQRGKEQVKAGDYRAAVTTLTQAIQDDPRAATAYFVRGEAYLELKQYAHAIDDYTHALTIMPNFADAFRRRAFARRKSDDIRGAIADYTTAIDLNADDKVAYLGRGLAYGDGLQDWQHAADDASQALAIDPDYRSAYINRAVARRNLGDYAGSLADYTEAIKRDPETPSGYLGRALVYLQLQDYQKAVDDLNIVIQRNPTDASAFCSRGAAYYGLYDYHAAIRDATAAIQLDAGSICGYSNRGLARAALGDTSNARSDYQQALKFAEACTCSRDIEQHIRQLIQKLPQS